MACQIFLNQGHGQAETTLEKGHNFLAGLFYIPLYYQYNQIFYFKVFRVKNKAILTVQDIWGHESGLYMYNVTHYNMIKLYLKNDLQVLFRIIFWTMAGEN